MFVYAAKSFSQDMSDAKGTIPNAEFVGADREKKVRCTRWAKRKLSVFVVASASSNTLLEGCSMWFFFSVFLILLSVQRCFLQGRLDARGTIPNAD